MNSFYNEYLHVPKQGNGNVREKVMLARITISVVLMIVCLAAMSFSAFAFFQSSISSTNNIIFSANFEAAVSVVSITDETNTPISVSTPDNRLHTALLEPGDTSPVTVQGGGTAATGFCMLWAENGVGTYHTQQLGMDGQNHTAQIQFTLTVSRQTTVSIPACWGTSSYYDGYITRGENDELYILDSELVEMTIGATSSADVDEDEDAVLQPSTASTTATAATEITTAPTTAATSVVSATTATDGEPGDTTATVIATTTATDTTTQSATTPTTVVMEQEPVAGDGE